MQGVRGEHKTPGEFRISQNWIGGSMPSKAVYVPPPHTEIAELLKLMVQKNLLKAYGYGRGMHYKLPDKRINILGANTTNSVYEVDKSGAYSASSGANSASSNDNSASSGAYSASSPKKRLTKEQLKSLIISICDDWVSIDDIVKRSGKSTSYIRNTVIPLLLAEKSIEMMYPGTPRNPNQKYKVKK